MGILYEKRKQIAYLTLNRPEVHNAIDPETAVQLYEAWQDFRDDADCRCAIITGAGHKSFCAGMDLGKMIPLHTGSRLPQSDAERAVVQDPKLTDYAIPRHILPLVRKQENPVSFVFAEHFR